jgi:hypothetical protein
MHLSQFEHGFRTVGDVVACATAGYSLFGYAGQPPWHKSLEMKLEISSGFPL